MQEELGESEAAQRALEGELERVNARLAADNERATTRVTQLQDELGRVQTKLQEAQVAATARQAPTADDEELAGWKTRAEASEKKAVEAEHRAQMAEMRIGELTTQVRSLEDQLEHAAQTEPGTEQSRRRSGGRRTTGGRAGRAALREGPTWRRRRRNWRWRSPASRPRRASWPPSTRARATSCSSRWSARARPRIWPHRSTTNSSRPPSGTTNSSRPPSGPAPADTPATGPTDPNAHLDAVVASAQATTENDDDAGSLRSRLARAADRKRRPVKDESEWPD